ncbi:Mov34/MPN/PAD-1 family protein [Streptomyces bacillaris]|uniref:Mov34/MPN/PAD-1 family protein n=1 Tax=Streptomyces bacillaris TaxID=68179 RepID=UPI0035D7686D
MRRRRVEVILHTDVSALIRCAAAAAEGTETGGLLLGWWDAGTIVARHAVEVIDPEATPVSWTRDEGRAQQALDEALADLNHPWLGYIGDWHTHPASCGPSGKDEHSIRRASHEYDQPLLLLVHRADDEIEARVAHQGKICALTIHHPQRDAS